MELSTYIKSRRENIGLTQKQLAKLVECCDCAYYWQNTDTENECVGEDEPCYEFIEFKGMGY